MTYYCPFCWSEIDGSTEVCPRCGSNLRKFSNLSYEEKLLVALRQPIPENRRLAIQILGELRSERVLPEFRKILEIEEDVFVVSEVVRALAAIGSERSLTLLAKAAQHR
jgi:HEAT repeat protein